MRVLLRSPKDTVAAFLAFAAVIGIVGNALFLQHGRHPAPMFGHAIVLPSSFSPESPLPRPRPLAADDTGPIEPRQTERRIPDTRAAVSDPLASLVKATASIPVAPTNASPPANVIRPPAPIPMPVASPHRIAAIQRALTQYGYGQLRPTGTDGPETQAAIRRFEIERRMPVTGQVTERLMRELSAVIGHPIN